MSTTYTQERLDEFNKFWDFHQASLRRNDWPVMHQRGAKIGYFTGVMGMASRFLVTPDNMDLTLAVANLREGATLMSAAFNQQVEPESLSSEFCLFDEVWAEIDKPELREEAVYRSNVRVWAYTGAHDFMAVLSDSDEGRNAIVNAIMLHCEAVTNEMRAA